ncbi:MAG: hypothetical protein M0Z50_09335 [Planctomycetia bacterium]|jgi:hypothetical protein|nr:hypothetical protein [Planctomycetia bacterium]
MNKNGFIYAPLFAIAMLGTSAPMLANAGTLTMSGFSAQRTPHVLLQAEQIMFYGRVGHIKAECAGKPLDISQVKPLYKVNLQLAHECQAGLHVTLTSHAYAPLKNAAILK